jgi:hypothetical protein
MILASLLIILIYFRKRPVELVKNVVLFGFGLALVLSPWIWRNYQETGKLFLDSPSFRVEDILVNIDQMPSETQPSPEKEQGEISVSPSIE